jgi:hypothetical protein
VTGAHHDSSSRGGGGEGDKGGMKIELIEQHLCPQHARKTVKINSTDNIYRGGGGECQDQEEPWLFIVSAKRESCVCER